MGVDRKAQKVQLSGDEQECGDSSSFASSVDSDFEKDEDIKQMSRNIELKEKRSELIYKNVKKDKSQEETGIGKLFSLIPKYGEKMPEINLGTDGDSKQTENDVFTTKSKILVFSLFI